MSKKVADIVKTRIAEKVTEAVSSKNVTGDASTVAPVTQAVMEEVGPTIDHLTGQVPLWQSQTFWGLIFLIGTRELALRGWALPPEFHGPVLDLLVGYGPYAAAMFIAWGRWWAKKPLFSSFWNRWSR